MTPATAVDTNPGSWSEPAGNFQPWPVGQNPEPRGAWVAQPAKRLPSAQVTIPKSWDRVPQQAPCSTGSLPLPLPLPAAPPACALFPSDK